MLFNRARLTLGIDHVQANIPAPASTASLSGYAVGVVLLHGRNRVPMAVVLPMDPTKRARELQRLIMSPAQLAMEMQLGYVDEQPIPPGRVKP